MGFTDNEIIKALECCTNKEKRYCRDCPLKAELPCVNLLATEAFDLINRQKAEIERYEKEHNEKFDKWKLLNERTKERYAELYEEAKSVVRAKAIKEFEERMKKLLLNCPKVEIGGFEYFPIGFSLIDNLVKEMVGDAE